MNRYAMANRVHETLGVPVSYDQWPYGMQNRSGYTASQSDEQLKRQLASRRVTLLLGDLDILLLAGFDGSCSAMAQGPTRLARGQAFAKYVNEQLGAQHTVTVVGSAATTPGAFSRPTWRCRCSSRQP